MVLSGWNGIGLLKGREAPRPDCVDPSVIDAWAGCSLTCVRPPPDFQLPNSMEFRERIEIGALGFGEVHELDPKSQAVSLSRSRVSKLPTKLDGQNDGVPCDIFRYCFRQFETSTG